MADAGVRVGVDVGGTFTDVVTIRDGDVDVAKTPSTPDDPDRAVVEGVLAAVERLGVGLDGVDALAHGTTVGTNAVLERDWAETALITTEGFRDALEIGRQNRPSLYDLHDEKPLPVVERDRRYEVPERLDERGDVLEELDEAAVRALREDLGDVESVAVCLLFAFENPAHERRVREVLSELNVSWSLSSDVLPEIREYERTVTTALNAALKPTLSSYLGRLAAALDDADAPLRVMASSGGIVDADAARERPVLTLLSGPAAGVRGATYVAGLAGYDDLLTMDMGGTSCDVSLVAGGDPDVTTDSTVGDYAVGVPSIDIHTVGAGGGSVAWLDDGGALRVGPDSAGADPGPVCYGRGGTDPTVTDAHAVLGRIDPDRFLDAPAPPKRVRESFADLAGALGTDVAGAARGVLRVANAAIERALRVVSVERGHDPRGFTLVAFGGAGPLHAPALAGPMGVERVLVPRAAGVLSALGLLASDLTYDHAVSRVRPWDAVSMGDLDGAFADLMERGRTDLADAGVPPDDRTFERTLDLRYDGQSFSLSVPLDSGDSLDDTAARFHDAHERRYGHADRGEPLELVTLRLRASGAVTPPALDPPVTDGTADDALAGTRRVGYADGDATARVYDRGTLPAGAAFDGPAVVEGGESTLVVGPDQRVRVDDHANLVVTGDA